MRLTLTVKDYLHRVIGFPVASSPSRDGSCVLLLGRLLSAMFFFFFFSLSSLEIHPSHLKF